jgi:radical SAM superfamily enzyme YgiQ (UPF0313 family)
MECKLNSGPMLTLQQIAAITPEKCEIELIDDRYDEPDFDTDADLIGISTLTASAPRAYKIADEFRRKGKTVVMGGMHPSALPEEALKHADSIVIGEAEGSWLELLKDFKSGTLKPMYKANSFVDMKDIPPPRHDLIKVNPIVSSVVTSRGCPNSCSFCSLTQLFGSTYRPRPVGDVINEIKNNPRRYFVLHNDSSLAIDKAYSKTLFKAMIPLKIKFIAYGNVPVLLKDDELVSLSKKAGCINWGFGFETFNKNSLIKDANKGYNIDDYEALIKKIHKNEIGVFGSFVFGFDHDTPDIFDITLEKIFDLGIDSGEFDILTPYPISKLFKTLDKQGRILTYDWEKYDFHHVVFEPKNMTKKELFEGCAKISKNFYSPLKIINRLAKVAFRSKDLIEFLAIASLNNVEYRFQKEYDVFRDKIT